MGNCPNKVCFCTGACMKKTEVDEDGIPIIPPLEETESPTDPNPVVAICGECGLRIHRVMGYACSNPRCPTGLGGPTAGN